MRPAYASVRSRPIEPVAAADTSVPVSVRSGVETRPSARASDVSSLENFVSSRPGGTWKPATWPTAESARATSGMSFTVRRSASATESRPSPFPVFETRVPAEPAALERDPAVQVSREHLAQRRRGFEERFRLDAGHVQRHAGGRILAREVRLDPPAQRAAVQRGRRDQDQGAGLPRPVGDEVLERDAAELPEGIVMRPPSVPARGGPASRRPRPRRGAAPPPSRPRRARRRRTPACRDRRSGLRSSLASGRGRRASRRPEASRRSRAAPSRRRSRPRRASSRAAPRASASAARRCALRSRGEGSRPKAACR